MSNLRGNASMQSEESVLREVRIVIVHFATNRNPQKPRFLPKQVNKIKFTRER